VLAVNHVDVLGMVVARDAGHPFSGMFMQVMEHRHPVFLS
jgi:hypothetical protein